MSNQPMNHGDVLVVGESLIDIVRDASGSTSAHVGGSAANVAVALARLGLTPRLATSFAPDDHGRRIERHLEADGVRLASGPFALARTATAAATLLPDGSASYAFDIEWRLAPVTMADRPACVHVCSIGALMAPGCEVVSELVDQINGVATITYDINLRPAITGVGRDIKSRVEHLAARSTIVKASDEDLAELYPDRSVEHSSQALLESGPGAVVVTRGAAGATVWTRAARVDVRPPRARVVDTIGAGDTFMAGLITALAERKLLGATEPGVDDLGAGTWREILAFAAAAAAISVGRAGAHPPYRAELPALG